MTLGPSLSLLGDTSLQNVKGFLPVSQDKRFSAVRENEWRTRTLRDIEGPPGLGRGSVCPLVLLPGSPRISKKGGWGLGLTPRCTALSVPPDGVSWQRVEPGDEVPCRAGTTLVPGSGVPPSVGWHRAGRCPPSLRVPASSGALRQVPGRTLAPSSRLLGGGSSQSALRQLWLPCPCPVGEQQLREDTASFQLRHSGHFGRVEQCRGSCVCVANVTLSTNTVSDSVT